MSEDIVREFAKLYKEDYCSFDDLEDVEMIDNEDFSQDGKYQSRSVIVKYKEIFIQINEYRSGSYHTDWYYNPSEIFQVERTPKVVTVYSNTPVGKMIEVDID